VRDIRNKGVVPNSKHFVALAWAAVEFAQAQLQQSGVASGFCWKKEEA
jgi:hypothetical protein